MCILQAKSQTCTKRLEDEQQLGEFVMWMFEDIAMICSASGKGKASEAFVIHTVEMFRS